MTRNISRAATAFEALVAISTTMLGTVFLLAAILPPVASTLVGAA
jgi:hypothetical protein